MKAAPKLILIRHGQASLGSSDYDRLSHTGQQQGRRLAARLAPVLGGACAAWSGTHRRHRQTFEALAPELRATEDRALDEFATFALIRAAVEQAGGLDFDLPAKHQFADPRAHLDTLLAWFPTVLAAWQRGELVDPGCGSWSAFRDRVLSPVPDWRNRLCAGEHVIVVSSAGVISTLVAELAGYDLARQRELAIRLYNASITELLPHRTGWRVDVLNCVAHLDAPELRTLA